jgi:hypothetical protein
MSNDINQTGGFGGGLGTGCVLGLPAPLVVPTAFNYLPGRGFYLHDRLDYNTFAECVATGHHYGWILSNCWVTVGRGAYEARMGAGYGAGSVGYWAWNTPSSLIIESPYIGGGDIPLLLENVDGHYATILPRLGGGATTYVRVSGGQFSTSDVQNPGGPAPSSCVVLGDHSRGMIELASLTGQGPGTTDPLVLVKANVSGWIIANLILPSNASSPNYNWINIDSTSEDNVTVVNCAPMRFPVSGNPLTDGPPPPIFQGPNNRELWPHQISFDPSSIAPLDGSPTAPQTLHSLQAGSGTSSNLLLARGGSIHKPGIIGSIGTNSTGLIIDGNTTTRIITTATVAVGGVGYWVGDILYDPYGGAWTVATVNSVGSVLTVTNDNPTAYTGTAPTNPVPTRTDNMPYFGSVITGQTAGHVTVTPNSPTAGYHYYTGQVSLFIGVPGLYVNVGGIAFMQSINPAGVQATATLTASGPTGAITGVTVTNVGTGYSGIGPSWQVIATPPSGCTLNFGPGVTPSGLSLNPSGGGIGFYGAAPVTKQTGVAVTTAAIHAALTSLGLIAP